MTPAVIGRSIWSRWSRYRVGTLRRRRSGHHEGVVRVPDQFGAADHDVAVRHAHHVELDERAGDRVAHVPWSMMTPGDCQPEDARHPERSEGSAATQLRIPRTRFGGYPLCSLGMTLALWTTSLGAQERFEFKELHMGMEVRIVLYASDEARARTAAREAFDRIEELENIMSDY